MISPYDREAGVLAAKIVEASPDLQFHRLHVMLSDFAEVVRREADAAAVQRMSRPLGALAQRIENAEARAARVRMLDSAEGLLAMDLAWACEELRKTDAARAASPPPPPGRMHEVDVETLSVRSCTDRAYIPTEPAENGGILYRCRGCGGSIVVTP